MLTKFFNDLVVLFTGVNPRQVVKDNANHKECLEIQYKEIVTLRNTVDKLTRYVDYLSESMNSMIDYSNHLGDELDTAIRYAEHIAEGMAVVHGVEQPEDELIPDGEIKVPVERIIPTYSSFLESKE